MGEDRVLYETNDQIVTVTVNRPHRLNAMSGPDWQDFRDALLRADDDSSVRVVVLSGTGEAFSSGDDIGDFGFETASEARAYVKHILRCALTIERIETPVVAKVDGLAHGGGCELAVISDVTIASEDASFRMPESRVGAIPAIGLLRFPAYIGLKRARELMLTNREVTAAEAHEIGLVNEVVPAAEIDDVVRERAHQIAKSAPMSTRIIKRSLNSRLSDESEGVNALNLVFMTEDILEGMDAFFEERDPEWVEN